MPNNHYRKPNPYTDSMITQEIIVRFLAGHTARRIERELSALPGHNITASVVNKATDKLLPLMQVWQTRALEPFYKVLFADRYAIRLYSNRRTRSLQLLTITGYHADGRRELLGTWLQDQDDRDRWPDVYRSLRKRGVANVQLICAGEPSMTESAALLFPQAERTLCGTSVLQALRQILSKPDAAALTRELKQCLRSCQPERDWSLLRMRWSCLSRLAAVRWDALVDALMVLNRLPCGIGRWLLLGGLGNRCRRDMSLFLEPGQCYRSQGEIDKQIYAAAVYIRDQQTEAPRLWPDLSEILEPAATALA